jgi:cellulose synthase/poly-beta-1,6-N-acetylglucosamine synthase-like glycosyltransferase
MRSPLQDYCLGMLMKAKGYKAGYLNEYLAIGEAPEEVRNVFRQRSRWCKGQMQVREHTLAAALMRLKLHSCAALVHSCAAVLH